MARIYSLEHKKFLINVHLAGSSMRETIKLFGVEYPDLPIPSLGTVHNYLRKYNQDGCLNDDCQHGLQRRRLPHVLTEEVEIRICSYAEINPFAELLESAYSSTFLFQMGLNMIVMSVTGVQIVMNLDNPDQVMRCLSSGISQILHLYMNSLPCQRLIDHSASIQDAVYSSPWYTFPLKTRPLIKIILMRVFIPCQITAGKLYVMSMESFSAVLKTSMSYFTLLLSFR